VVAGAVQDGNVVPGQTLTAVQQHRLVGLDREPVVRLLAGDEALGGVAVGGQRIGGDHGAGQLQSPSNGWNPGTSPGAPLTWRWRGRRGWCGPSRRADGPAGRRVGRPQGLAVDRDRPPPLRGATVTVGQPRAEHGGQRGGSTRARSGGWWPRPAPPTGRGVTPSAERGPYRLGASAAHAAIAVIDRAPAKTAAAAMARIATSGCGARRPAWGRGSWPGRRADPRCRPVMARRRGRAGPGRLGSSMMGRQAPGSIAIMRL
jgi:hypothetical protein